MAKRIKGVGFVASLLIAACVWLLHWTDPDEYRAYPDTFQYTRMALRIEGAPTPDVTALHVTSAESGVKSVDQRPGFERWLVERDNTFGPRYRAVFSPRIGLPLVLAAAYSVFGPKLGSAAGSAAMFVAASGFLYLAARILIGSRSAGLAAVVAFGLLPSGYWAATLLAESALMVGICATLCGVAVLTTSSERARHVVIGGSLTTMGLVFTVLARGVVGTSLAAVLALCALTLGRSVVPRTQRRLLVGICAAVGIGFGVVTVVFHQPGIEENLQLQATDRFTHPDVKSVWSYLANAEVRMLTDFIRSLPAHGYALVLIAAGVVTLLRCLGRRSWPWFSAFGIAVATGMSYPQTSSEFRFLSPLWIMVAAGFAAAVEAAWPAARQAVVEAPRARYAQVSTKPDATAS